MKKEILSRDELLGKNDILPKYKAPKKENKIKIPEKVQTKDLYFLFN